MTTTLFGVPEIYQDALSQKRPVLLALPLGSGMPVSIHSDEDQINYRELLVVLALCWREHSGNYR